MAHVTEQGFFELLRRHFPDMFSHTKVLEIGSFDINGSIRGFFKEPEYLGCDLEPGEGVDIVKAGQLLDFGSGSFDVVASAQCFEHNPYWAETFVNMLRMMKPDGAIIVSCASLGSGEHGTCRTSPSMSPFTVNKGWTYYKNLSEEDFTFLELQRWLGSWYFFESRRAPDLFFVGFGPSSKYSITKAFVHELKSTMSPTFRGTITRGLNLFLGNRLYQQFYLFVRTHAPFLLANKQT